MASTTLQYISMNKQTIFEGREHGYTVYIAIQRDQFTKGEGNMKDQFTVKQQKAPCLALQLHKICQSICEVFAQMSLNYFFLMYARVFLLCVYKEGCFIFEKDWT